MPMMPTISFLLALNLHAPEWSLSIRGGFMAARRLNCEEPGLSSWKEHAPPGFPIDSLDSLCYHYDESFALAGEAEANYRGFWIGMGLGGGSGNGFVDDGNDQVFGFTNYHFADLDLGLGYVLRMMWPIATSIGPFVQSGFLRTGTSHTYTFQVDTTVSHDESLGYVCTGLKARIPWALVYYLHPLSSGGINKLLVSVGGTILGEGDSLPAVYLGAYYDQSWNDRNNFSTMGCLLSVFGPGRRRE